MSLIRVSWLGVWVGIEMRVLTLTPLIVSRVNSVANESSMKYFLVQISSGLIFLAAINRGSELVWLFLMRLSLKLGIAPLHF